MTQTKNSLKDLTKIIYDKLIERKEMKIRDFTSYVMSQYSISIPEPSFRRRIYDVITVFTCLGYVEKNEGNLTWIGKPENSKPPEYDEIYTRILAKEDELRDKARRLLIYKALIIENRNKQRTNEPKAFIPFLYFDCPQDRYRIEWLDKNKVKITSTIDDIELMSPSEIIDGIKIHVSTLLQVFQECPILEKCRNLLMIDISGLDQNDLVCI